MKWFMHESSANRDTKLRKVLIKYGAEGYGLYWYCLEHICADVDPKLTFELEHDSEILAHELRIDTLKVEEMMRYMVHLGLFEGSGDVITCIKLARYLGDKNTRNEALQLIIKGQKQDLSRTVPDSPRLSALEERRLEEIRGDKKRKTPMPVSPKHGPAPVAEIISIYHRILPDHPAVQKVTKPRESQIKQRWREDLPAISNWENFFDYVAQSPFLTGRTPPRDDRPAFIADLEWLTKASNYTKILEGKYHGVR